MRIHGQELSADLLVRDAMLRDDDAVRRSLRAGAGALGCEVLSEHHHRFEPAGLTAVAIIGESHLLVSTYPELGVASFNIQTCSSRLRLIAAIEAICETLAVETVRSLVHLRHLDVPFSVELCCEMVPFREGRLDFDGARERRGRGAPFLASDSAFASAG